MELRLSKRYFDVGNPLIDISVEIKKEIQKFQEYQKANFKKISTVCLCGNDDSYLISNIERLGNEYPLVLCRKCGLIRAKNYWDKESTKKYYKDWYRKITGGKLNIEKLHLSQIDKGKKMKNFIKEFLPAPTNNYTVVDPGGCSGGILESFREYKSFLFDFDEDFLAYASKQGITAIKGGIDKLINKELSPGLIILNHVLEHFTNANTELDKIKCCLKVGSLVYIALPGIDSLKKGRRRYDFLGYIQEHHVTYFCEETLTNLMNRHGFRCLKSNTTINALYEYTSEKKDLVNYHDVVVKHIRRAELIRKTYILFRIYLSKPFPMAFKKWVRKYIQKIPILFGWPFRN